MKTKTTGRFWTIDIVRVDLKSKNDREPLARFVKRQKVRYVRNSDDSKFGVECFFVGRFVYSSFPKM